MRLLWRQHGRGFIADDGGFTTIGMVLALLITLSLLFTTAQVYRVQTASASVQNVADSVALAAEGPVAEFYVVVRVCDAISLSLTLTGVVVTGVGIVALCIPPTAALGSKLIEVGKSVFSARDSFVEQANAALEAHELIKCSVLDTSSLDVREAASELAERCGAEVVQVIGRKFSIYRETSRDDVEKIKLD